MAAKQILNRIDRRLQIVGLTEHAASKQAGHPELIRNLRRAVRNGVDRGVKMAPFKALAKELRTTAEWLIDQVGPEELDAERQMIPVKGQVGAGGVVIPNNDGDIGAIEAPPNSGSQTAAVEIVGESLGRLFNGWYAIYDDSRDPPTEDLIGELCVLQTAEGLMYIKKLKKGRGKKFTLESNYEAPITDVIVTWAAKVKTMVPR